MSSTRKSSRLAQVVVPKTVTPKKPVTPKFCYIIFYECKNDMLIPIYINEQLGETFMENMDLVKTIEPNISLRYAKKCCKQVYNFMSKYNSKIYPDLAKKVFEKLGGIINEEKDVFDYEFEKKIEEKIEEKKEKMEEKDVFQFDWDIDELTKTTWDLIDWENEKEEKIDDAITVYESDEEYEDKNKRMKFSVKKVDFYYH